MERALAKVRKVAKGTTVVTLSPAILEASGLGIGTHVMIGAVDGRIVIMPVDPTGLNEALGIEEEEEERVAAR